MWFRNMLEYSYTRIAFHLEQFDLIFLQYMFLMRSLTVVLNWRYMNKFPYDSRAGGSYWWNDLLRVDKYLLGLNGWEWHTEFTDMLYGSERAKVGLDVETVCPNYVLLNDFQSLRGYLYTITYVNIIFRIKH